LTLKRTPYWYRRNPASWDSVTFQLMIVDVEKHVTTWSNIKSKPIVSSTEMQQPEFSVTFPQWGRYMQAVYIHRMVAVERNENSRFFLLPHNSQEFSTKPFAIKRGWVAMRKSHVRSIGLQNQQSSGKGREKLDTRVLLFLWYQNWHQRNFDATMESSSSSSSST
jgi:hypothetical protein